MYTRRFEARSSLIAQHSLIASTASPRLDTQGGARLKPCPNAHHSASRVATRRRSLHRRSGAPAVAPRRSSSHRRSRRIYCPVRGVCRHASLAGNHHATAATNDTCRLQLRHCIRAGWRTVSHASLAQSGAGAPFPQPHSASVAPPRFHRHQLWCSGSWRQSRFVSG